MNDPGNSLPLTFTLDLENHRTDGRAMARYRDNAARILDFLAGRGIRATIFIVGDLVRADCALLLRAQADGHELALHSYRHIPLTLEDRTTYGTKLAAAKHELESICGSRVCGFRAPIFSLIPSTRWVLDILHAAAFEYSSSVLPARNPQFGYPGAATGIFRWPNGLLEIPVPLARLAGVSVPFLGGIYLRYLPRRLLLHMTEKLPASSAPWTYIHPYDIDSADPYFRFPGTSALMSLLLWRQRGGTLKKLDALFRSMRVGPPFAEQIKRGVFANVALAPGPEPST